VLFSQGFMRNENVKLVIYRVEVWEEASRLDNLADYICTKYKNKACCPIETPTTKKISFGTSK
jgi:hypothetical protein